MSPLQVVDKKDLTTLEEEISSKNETDLSAKKEVVTQLAMEWDDEEEAQNESA